MGRFLAVFRRFQRVGGGILRITDHTLTRADVAWLVGMSDSWVRDRMQAGDFPKPGQTAEEYVEAFVDYKIGKLLGDQEDGGGGLSFDRERARLTKAQADSKEMDNAERRGELASRPDMTAAVVGLIKVAVARLMQVPAAVAQGDASLRLRIETTISDALRDLSITRVEEAMGGSADDEEAPYIGGDDEDA